MADDGRALKWTGYGSLAHAYELPAPVSAIFHRLQVLKCSFLEFGAACHVARRRNRRLHRSLTFVARIWSLRHLQCGVAPTLQPLRWNLRRPW